MASNKLKEQIVKILKKDDRLWNEEKTELNQTLLMDLVEKIDETIIDLILQEKETREKFFVKIKDVYVFKTNDFRFFMEENRVDNSYTQYKNQIGLTNGKRFLKDTNDVVLDFPYKDCVLEGGMTKEDEKNRKEIFFNQVLAKDEIDRLLDEKALINWKRFTRDGEEDVKEIKRYEDGTIKENLIIKGNNLLALHSLKKQFTGKVKLIYIDPPYNTSGDSFEYNDSFNHSTWLTFMKNRLEIAKELLCESGVIFVHIDYIEQAYLKVLMDELFGNKQALPPVTVKTSTPAGFKVINPGLVNVSESILIYAKGDKKLAIKKGYVKASYQKDYSKVIINKSANPENWVIKNLKNIAIEKLGFKSFIEVQDKFDKQTANNLINQEMESYAINQAESVFATYGPHKPSNKLAEGIKKSKKNPGSIISVPNDDGNYHYLINGRLMAFYSNKLQEIDGEIVPTQRLTDFWSDLSWDSLSGEGGVTLKNGKKPEKLLKRIVEISTEEGDLVLDYHLGSGTTCAVAHKMGRQYIGIEQLDYREDDSVVRLKNVIEGDQSGISKAVDWKEGGDFIYIELAKWNEQAKEEIINCKDLKELEKLLDTLYERYFLNYNLKIKEFKEEIIKEENFNKLSLDEQKKMFLTMLDLNQMYVQRSEMADKKFEIDKKDQKLTSEFYGCED